MAEVDLGKIRGSDGVSPSVEPNPGNTDGVYRLDICTAEGKFTTPNLKGADAQTGGLAFGQDEEGNWGYIPPGADTVVPFRQGGAAGGGVPAGYVMLGMDSAVSAGVSSGRAVEGVMERVPVQPVTF